MIRPTLAVSIDTEEQLAAVLKEHGSLFTSEKKDGIRAIVSSGVLMSRQNKPIPNMHVQKFFSGLPEGLDGELIFGIDGYDIHPPLEQINSVVTSRTAEWPKRWRPMYCVFDHQEHLTTERMPFHHRYSDIKSWCNKMRRAGVWFIPQFDLTTMFNIIEYFKAVIEAGGEGICLRSPRSPYKKGRSTLRDGCLMRFKKLIKDQAVVIDSYPLERHVGSATVNSFGLAQRDSKLTNLLKDETQIGGLVCFHPLLGKFKVGSGFTAAQRKRFAKEGSPRHIVFEYRDLTHKGVPRNATFVEPCPS